MNLVVLPVIIPLFATGLSLLAHRSLLLQRIIGVATTVGSLGIAIALLVGFLAIRRGLLLPTQLQWASAGFCDSGGQLQPLHGLCWLSLTRMGLRSAASKARFVRRPAYAALKLPAG